MRLTDVQRQKLDNLHRRNLLAWSISNIDLSDGKSWSLNDRKWLEEPYLALSPADIEKNPISKARKLAIRKSTQAGISTLSIAKALHFMSYWDVRVGYMLPRQADISIFSLTRVDPMIARSPFLLSKLGQPNSTYTKTLGNSYLYFLEGSVEPRSIPMDMLLLDEVDLSNPDHVGTAINRLDASPWKLTVWLSTPTLPATGIDAVYDASDRRAWMVKCPHCNEWQDLDWEQNLVQIGPADNPTNVYYGCKHCGKELTMPDIQEGQWVPEYPTRSDEMIGYHISQMMTTSARELYGHFRDPQQTLSEFYRKRLGKPYTMAGGSIEREDFMINCFDEPFGFDLMSDGESSYYMGVDQGNQLQVVVGKVEKGKRRPKIVHIELVPFADGFERIKELIKKYKPKRCIIDGDPNRHPVKDLQLVFPGRVIMADYVEQRERFVKKLGQIKNTPLYRLPIGATINRTEAFDDLISSIKDGLWQLPGDPSRLPAEVEMLIDHVTALKRDVEKRRTASGEVEVGVWRKLRAEHLAHAWVYLKTAMDFDHQASFRSAVIGARTSQKQEVEQEEVLEDTSGKLKEEDFVEIVSKLAEVPVEQIKEYTVSHASENYKVPFPLRYKLSKLSNFEQEQVLQVMDFILKSWKM